MAPEIRLLQNQALRETGDPLHAAVADMSDMMHGLSDTVHLLKERTDNLYGAIAGNEEIGHVGLAGQIKAVKKEQESQGKEIEKHKKFMWVLMGIGLAWETLKEFVLKQHKIIILGTVLLFLTGCSFLRGTRKAQVKDVQQNATAITEQSKALTTGIVDALSFAPTNPPTDLARDFAKHNQLLQGLPLERIDVAGIFASNKVAITSLQARYEAQSELLKERQVLETKLKATEDKLIEMGKLYEAEHNQNILKRTWHWLFATLGLGGIIALCVFCPVVIPIFARILGWIVGKIPSLAGVIGVVSHKAFDAVVSGVGTVREQFKQSKNVDALQAIDTSLAVATDAEHKALIDQRRVALGV